MGTKVNFWRDNWLGDGPLLFKPVNPFDFTKFGESVTKKARDIVKLKFIVSEKYLDKILKANVVFSEEED